MSHQPRPGALEAGAGRGGGGDVPQAAPSDLAAAASAPLGASTNSAAAAVERLGSCAGPLIADMVQGWGADDSAAQGGRHPGVAGGSGAVDCIKKEATAAADPARRPAEPLPPLLVTMAAAAVPETSAGQVVTPAVARGDVVRLPLFLQTSALTTNVSSRGAVCVLSFINQAFINQAPPPDPTHPPTSNAASAARARPAAAGGVGGRSRTARTATCATSAGSGERWSASRMTHNNHHSTRNANHHSTPLQ
jgi:hypothetical protein